MFEIPASNFQKAKAFYEAVFDWKVELWGEQGAMALTTAVDKDYNPTEPGGINGGFYKRTSKDDHASFGVQTESIDKTLKVIERAGGKVVTPKHAIGEWGSWRTLRIPKATSSRSGNGRRNDSWFTTRRMPMRYVDLHPKGQGVRMVFTFDAMHDEEWTQRTVMGWEMELGKLEKTIGERK